MTKNTAKIPRSSVKKSLTEHSPMAALLAGSGLWGALYLRRKKFSYRNQKVLITGGSRGLGLSLAWNLVGRGAHVSLLARDSRELERGKKILLRDFPDAKVECLTVDITETGEFENAIDQAIDRMGGINLLINNAGSILVGPFETMKQEDYERLMQLHLYAPIRGITHVIPYFKKQRGGRILNISSLGGKRGIPHMAAYNASKFALTGWAQGVSAELRAQNIKMTTVHPTVMRTGSPIQVWFKGDVEAEFAWFSTIDHLPIVSMSAHLAAKKILAAVQKEQTDVILSLTGKIQQVFGALFPQMVQDLVTSIHHFMPTGQSTQLVKGAHAQKQFESIEWLKPLRTKARLEQERYNQKTQEQ